MDKRLCDKISDALDSTETVVYITRRDPIVILPKIVSNLVWTTILLLNVYAFWNVGFGLEQWWASTGIVSRLCIVLLFIIWAWLFVNDFAAWDNEVFAITQTEGGKPSAYYRKGVVGHKTLPVKLSSLVATPVNQAKHMYDRVLQIGTLQFDTFGSEQDIFLVDAPRPFDIIHIVNRLSNERNNRVVQ